MRLTDGHTRPNRTRTRTHTHTRMELRQRRGRALLSAICKCIVEPVSSSSSEVLAPSRWWHRAFTALETCSSDSLEEAAAALPFLAAAAGGVFAFFALGGAFFALGGAFFALTGAATGVAAVAAADALRFFGFSTGVDAAAVGSALRFLSFSTGAGLLIAGIPEESTDWVLRG